MPSLPSWPEDVDAALVDVLRAFPTHVLGPAEEIDIARLFARAELHGVAGLVLDSWTAAGRALDPGLEPRLRTQDVARQLDHAAHLALLVRIDDAFRRAQLRGVLLKGPILAERVYPRPSARATSDVDLLVAEHDLPRAIDALASIGYRWHDSPSEQRFRREHHHLHLTHAHYLPLELHFHAYRGLGSVLRSEQLLARSRRIALTPGAVANTFTALRVLAPTDEFVYLSAHAAAHRFVRLGWLLDLKLLLATMSPDEVAEVERFARASGYERVLRLTTTLLSVVLRVPASDLQPLRGFDDMFASWIVRFVREPEVAVWRSATRFVYSASLCDSLPAAARYAMSTSRSRLRGLVGLDA